jgi:hypothetical protein
MEKSPAAFCPFGLSGPKRQAVEIFLAEVCTRFGLDQRLAS